MPGRTKPDHENPYAGLNLDNARMVGGLMWFAGAAIALVLLPFDPPTVRFGWSGWLVAGVGIAISFAMAARRLRFEPPVTVDELLVTGYFGVVLIAVLEWLAGGQSSPYHYLYALPAVFAGALHSPRRLVPFGAALILAVCAPLLYGSAGDHPARGTVALLLLLFALVVVARVLIGRLRAQRTSLQGERDQAALLARRDALTGLGNRLAFEEALGRAVARAQRSGNALSLVMADLDGFKRINDELGHVEGDRCLCAVAAEMTATARAGDECYRWGGDEFALILADTPTAEAEQAASRLATAVAGIAVAGEAQQLSLTCSVAELREGTGAAELVASADRVLLERKGPREPAQSNESSAP